MSLQSSFLLIEVPLEWNFSFHLSFFREQFFRLTSSVYVPFDNYWATINATHKCLISMTKSQLLKKHHYNEEEMRTPFGFVDYEKQLIIN